MAEKKFLDQEGVKYLWSKISMEDYPNNDTLVAVLNAIDETKQDKIIGKGLSTNDYTTEEKNKLAAIQEGAEVNVQADWNVTDETSDAFIKNKPVPDSTLTIEGAAADAKVTGDAITALSEEIAKLPTGGGAAIIDVVEIPSDPKKDVIYRVAKIQAVRNGVVNQGVFVHTVECLPETGVPTIVIEDTVVGSLVYYTFYFNIADDIIYGYIDEASASTVGIAYGWYTLDELSPLAVKLLGVEFGGIIHDMSDSVGDEKI